MFGGVMIGRKIIDFVGDYFCNELAQAMWIADVEHRKTNKALSAVTPSVVNAINVVTLLM